MVLLVDLSEVFIHGMYDMDKVIKHRFGIELAERFKKRHEKPEVWAKLQDLFRGKISEEVYWKFFMKDGEPWPEGIKPTVFSSALEENLRKRIDGTVEVFQNMVDLPKRVLVSDHIKEHVPFIMREHPEVFKLMDMTYWSCDLGFIKKDPDFFPRVLNLLEVSAENVLYIDDYSVNLESARNAGIKDTILFQNPAGLQMELKNRGFTFKEESAFAPGLIAATA